jgi:VCBS repeat-containing protein
VLTVGAPGVLGNDSDGDGDPFTALLVTGPEHGTLALNPDGSLTYTPAPDYNGPDSFTYRAADAQADSNVATVTIAVSPVTDAPVAANDGYTKAEGATLVVAAPGVLGNDADKDGNPLTAILVSGPAQGTLTLSPDGGFTYTSNANYSGSDSFTYIASDGTLSSNVATVTFNITATNDPPVAGNDSYVTDEDVKLIVGAPGLLANDTDVDSSTIRAVKASNPSHGTVVVNADGSFVYTPAANYHGPDSFTYRAQDEVNSSNIATVTLMVNSVPDAPVANNQSKSLSEDGTRAITLTGSDGDGDALTFAIVAPPAHGALTGTAPNVTYVPAANFNGAESFTFQVSDGAVNSNVATVSLTVTAVNDAPVAQAASYTTPRNTQLAGQLLASDVEHQPLTYTVTNQPNKGTVTVNPLTGAFVYTPTSGKTGSDSFRFKANDGTANSNAARIDIQIQ